MRTIRFLWVDPPRQLQGYQADVQDQVLADREITPHEAHFPGPTGTYRLVDEETWRWLEPADPAPVFVHEDWRLNFEKWVQPIPDPSQEAWGAARARDSVIQLVEDRLAQTPGAFSVGPTHTTTEQSGRQLTVVGRCLVLSPA
jgi:hypothetical protein